MPSNCWGKIKYYNLFIYRYEEVIVSDESSDLQEIYKNKEIKKPIIKSTIVNTTNSNTNNDLPPLDLTLDSDSALWNFEEI